MVALYQDGMNYLNENITILKENEVAGLTRNKGILEQEVSTCFDNLMDRHHEEQSMRENDFI